MGFFNDIKMKIGANLIKGIVKSTPGYKQAEQENNRIKTEEPEKWQEIQKQNQERLNKLHEQEEKNPYLKELNEKINSITKEPTTWIDRRTESALEQAQDNITEINETNGNTQNIEDTQDTTATQNTPSIEKLWEREDAIRKETQEREDTAYQRAIEDMRKAGINPNLVGISPAGSGGGIISATGQNLISTEMSGAIQEAIAQINNTVKADENQKDRISNIIKTLAMYFILKKK